MIFKAPKYKEVYDTLTGNDELISRLLEKEYLESKSSLMKIYEREQVENMDATIISDNKSIMEGLSEILCDNSDHIKGTSIELLSDNKYKYTEIAQVFGLNELDDYTYKLIYYAYKYCYVSSFFQNNCKSFLPEYDYSKIQDHEITKAFVDSFMKEFDKIDCTISKCASFVDLDNIPYDYISYLTQLLGFDKKNIYAENEKQYRELCKCMIDIFRVKGTNYSFELLFGFLGYNITISEYWFDRRFYFNNTKGNTETDESDNTKKEYYLTTTNPSMNSNKCFTKPDIVTSNDITKQYSLLEFEDLVEEYGPEAVLGYSPFDINGDKYTEKVYKYFKTNYVYYSVKSNNGENPTAEQLNIISKYIELLTPAFIMKNVNVEVYSDTQTENITFEGDGEKDSDGDLINKPVTFQMLDSESWDSRRKDLFLKDDSSGSYYLDDNNNKVYYKNSLAGCSYDKAELAQTKIFRKPLSYTYLYYNTNRFSGNDGLTRMVGRRLFHYGYTDSDGNTTYSWSFPFITGNDEYYGRLVNEVYEATPKSNMIGDSSSLKSILAKKTSDNYYKIDYYTSKSLSDFISDTSSSFNKLSISMEMNTTAEIVDKIKISGSESALYVLKRLYGIYKGKYYIANVKANPSSLSDFSTLSELSNYITYGTGNLAKKAYYGCYMLCYDDSYAYLERIISPKKYYNGAINQTYVKCHSFGYKEMLRTDTRPIYIADSTYSTLSAFEKYINNLNSLSMSEKLSVFSSINLNTLYGINEKYYYITIEQTPMNAKTFTSAEEAEKYYAAKPSEIYNGSRYYISNGLTGSGLYSYKYSERKPGATIYSSNDGKLYKIFGIDSSNIEEIDFDGRLEVEDGEARIYLYDQTWIGYDEQADRDDFIFYNYYHTVNYMNHNGIIKRPIKSVCDSEFDVDNYGKSNLVDVSSGVIKNYVGSSADLLTPSELYKFDDNGKGVGLISIIEYYTQFKNDSKINYYSSISEFFIDYYRYIIKDINCYSNGIKFPYPMYWDDSSEKYIISKDETDSAVISAANNVIKEKFDLALYNMKIIKDFITNKSYFTTITESVIYSENDIKDIEALLDSEYLSLKVSDKRKVDNYKLYRNGIIKIIKQTHKSTGMNVIYGDNKSKYTYTGTEDMSEILLSNINFSVYSKDSYKLSYKLVFVDGNYNQDYFGEYIDCYSKFANIYDIFMSDIDTSSFTESSCDFSKYKSGCSASTRRAKIDEFLKYIYYSKMVALYREKAFGENIDGLSIEDRNANQATPKLSERLDGKGGNLMLTSTLSSMKENNGGKNDRNIKIPFKMCAYTPAKSGTEFKFYIKKSDMVQSSGLTFNEELSKLLACSTDITYKMTDDSGNTSIVYDYTLRRKAIEDGYKKKIAVIKPIFYNDTSESTSKLSTDGKVRAGSYFNENIKKIVEKNHDDITITNFPPMDFSSVTTYNEFVEYTEPSNWMLKIKDATKYYILSYKDSSITTALYDSLVPVSAGTDQDTTLSFLDSLDGYEGYIEINNMNSSLIDNYVSVPQSMDWIDLNAEGNKDEFISFGDDREINVSVDNKYFDKDSSIEKEKIYNKYINSMRDSTNNAVLSVKDADGNIGDYKYYARDAINGQYNLSYTYTEGTKADTKDSAGNTTYKVPFDEEQQYKIGNEYKKDCRSKIFKTSSGDILIETSSLFMGDVKSITLLYEVLYMTLEPYKVISWWKVDGAVINALRTFATKSIDTISQIAGSASFGINMLSNAISGKSAVEVKFASLGRFFDKIEKNMNAAVKSTYSSVIRTFQAMAAFKSSINVENMKVRRNISTINIISKMLIKNSMSSFSLLKAMGIKSLAGIKKESADIFRSMLGINQSFTSKIKKIYVAAYRSIALKALGLKYIINTGYDVGRSVVPASINGTSTVAKATVERE